MPRARRKTVTFQARGGVDQHQRLALLLLSPHRQAGCQKMGSDETPGEINFPPTVYQGMWNSPEQLPTPCAHWHWEPNPWPWLAPAAPRGKKCTQGWWWQQKQTFHPNAPVQQQPLMLLVSKGSSAGAVKGSAISSKWKGHLGWKIKQCHARRGKKKHKKPKTNTHTPKTQIC